MIRLPEHADESAAHGVPPEISELLDYLFGEALDGPIAGTIQGVVPEHEARVAT